MNPLSKGSSETWNSVPEEIDMSLNGLYKAVFWPVDQDDWTDDWMYREDLTPVTNATVNGQSGWVGDWWKNAYKCIARANDVIASVDRAADVLSQEQRDRYVAEARFVRASQYALLLARYRNIVYTETMVEIDEALTAEQADPEMVLQKIYADYDFAAANLKTEYSANELKRATAGAALAMKARIALQMSDWEVAKEAAKACMDLGIYKLHSDFAGLFLSKTKNSVETIFGFPRSIELNVTKGDCQNYVSRNAGGWAAKVPSWDLFCAFLCTDGLPIDKSPLFNPHKPFENRDPRCTKTIVEFQTPLLGFMYQPHPDSLQVLNVNTGKKVNNNDTRSVAQYASYNGLLWKKGVDDDWLKNSWKIEPDQIIIRYADVLLMYAEAKIELGALDESVTDAINQVRARAYGVEPANVAAYPAVQLGSQSDMRRIVRTERRMEFALEGIRYMDIIRWNLAEKVLNKPNYGLLDVADLRKKVIEPKLWFFPQAPTIDEDGVADFSIMASAGLIKQITIRKFDASRQYLWPIPTTEILTNSNLKQNPNY
ncbi:RagB/SusD family nutrient uptake outer membrane protein [Olivibacter ginsenosidimutans]|uniref:RagB/SusD family nutrient uptake outer membrane protein n=2 Tax=Olivibacter ginsenosidimutans TaxID=1176537 RepID=A0ABP9CAQ3_9SPHI